MALDSFPGLGLCAALRCRPTVITGRDEVRRWAVQGRLAVKEGLDDVWYVHSYSIVLYLLYTIQPMRASVIGKTTP